MKLAALYSVYNGLELLEASIRQIYHQVDHVVICFQEVSNTGSISEDVEAFVERFRGREKFHVIEYIPNLNLNTKQNEQRKLQLRIDYAKELGCSHFFSSATDHFYDEGQFVWAKNWVEKNNYDVTFTHMFTYYKNPTWRLTPIEGYFMPFICRLYPHTTVVRLGGYPVRVDPSVQINTCDKHYIFSVDEIMMHHFSMIRTDIRDKFKNAAASMRWKPEQVARFIREFEEYDLEINPGVSYFQGRKIQVVPNKFKL